MYPFASAAVGSSHGASLRLIPVTASTPCRRLHTFGSQRSRFTAVSDATPSLFLLDFLVILYAPPVYMIRNGDFAKKILSIYVQLAISIPEQRAKTRVIRRLASPFSHPVKLEAGGIHRETLGAGSRVLAGEGDLHHPVRQSPGGGSCL